MINLGTNRNKISARSVYLGELHSNDINPYMCTIYTAGGGLPFKPDDIRTYFIECKVDNHCLVIE